MASYQKRKLSIDVIYLKILTQSIWLREGNFRSLNWLTGKTCVNKNICSRFYEGISPEVVGRESPWCLPISFLPPLFILLILNLSVTNTWQAPWLASLISFTKSLSSLFAATKSAGQVRHHLPHNQNFSNGQVIVKNVLSMSF